MDIRTEPSELGSGIYDVFYNGTDIGVITHHVPLNGMQPWWGGSAFDPGSGRHRIIPEPDPNTDRAWRRFWTVDHATIAVVEAYLTATK